MKKISKLLLSLLLSASLNAGCLNLCGLQQEAAEQKTAHEQPTEKDLCSDLCLDIKEFAEQFYNKCSDVFSTDNMDPFTNFTPDTYVTTQLPQDKDLLYKMKPLFFEKEDRTIFQTTTDVLTAHDPYAKRKDKVYRKAVTEHSAQEVMMLTEDKKRISGLYFKRENAPLNIIFVAGYFRGQTPTKEWSAPFSQVFPEYNLLSFDWRGFSKSEGLASEFGIDAHQDVQAALEFMRKQNDKPTIMIGFCFGAALMLKATEYALQNGKPTADALVVNCTPTRMENMKKRVAQLAPNWLLKTFFSFKIPQDYILTHLAGELFNLNPIDMIENIPLPMLFEYYTGDKSVLVTEGIENYLAAPTELKSMSIYEIGGHARCHSKAPTQYRKAFDAFAVKAGLLQAQATHGDTLEHGANNA